MIRFSCKCRFEFELPADRAGSMVQCPRCALLVDVPTAAELAWMAPDGTLALDDDAGDGAGHAVPGQTLAEMYRAFSRKHTDADGNPIDLRPGPDHYRRLDAATPVEGYRPQRIAPRYDPATGERIAPLALKDEPPTPVIPLAVEVDPSEIDTFDTDDDSAADAADGVMPVPVVPIGATPVPLIPPARGTRAGPAAVRSLGYATGDANRQVTARTLAIDLLTRPPNLVVLFFVFWFYAVAVIVRTAVEPFAAIVHMPAAVAVGLFDLPLWLLVAHYACVIEDVGPEAIDELPRPLRNFSIGDDLFAPGIRGGAAIALCYGPMAAFVAATGLARPAEGAIALALAALGSVAFPAVALTLVTGTTVLNLTPGRAVGVAVACGGQYALSAALALAVLTLSAVVVLGPTTLPALAGYKVLFAPQHLTLLVPALAMTAYVTHLFAWHLGLMYRAHHDRFPWLAQRHVRGTRALVD